MLPLDATGTFSYTRRDDALSGMTYTVWYSLDLEHWFKDTGATQAPEPPDEKDVETVLVILTPALLGEPRLFVRVQAGGG